MGAFGAVATALLVLISAAGCRQDIAAAPASDLAVEGDPLAAVVDPFVGWPPQLRDVVISARERFEVPSVFPTVGFELPGDAVLVDVRTPDEVAVSVIPGSRLLSDNDLREAFLNESHPGPVVVYCTAGWRSAEFTVELIEAGIEAVNLEGGLCGWALTGGTMVDGKGAPTERIHAFSDDFAPCVPGGFEAVFD